MKRTYLNILLIGLLTLMSLFSFAAVPAKLVQILNYETYYNQPTEPGNFRSSKWKMGTRNEIVYVFSDKTFYIQLDNASNYLFYYSLKDQKYYFVDIKNKSRSVVPTKTVRGFNALNIQNINRSTANPVITLQVPGSPGKIFLTCKNVDKTNPASEHAAIFTPADFGKKFPGKLCMLNSSKYMVQDNVFNSSTLTSIAQKLTPAKYSISTLDGLKVTGRVCRTFTCDAPIPSRDEKIYTR